MVCPGWPETGAVGAACGMVGVGEADCACCCAGGIGDMGEEIGGVGEE